MEPRRDTVLDARLRGAATFAGGRRPAPGSLAARALDVVGRTTRAEVPERTSAKLIVRSDEMGQALDWLASAGGELVSRPADSGSSGTAVVIANVPVTRLSDLDGQPWLRRAEAPKEMFARMDSARGAVTGLDAALALPVHNGLTGAGVLLAVVDSGVDWSHPDFCHKDGTTRLERFLHAHRGDDDEVSTYRAFDADAINHALNGGPDIPAGDPGGHGTHCASIAAGNGFALADARFRGVAPEAALMGVRSEPFLDEHLIEGIRQAFALAGDRPAVVSMSLGGHWGAHDGTSALENEIAQASGPGRVIVVAAGNEGEDGLHVQGRLVPGQDLVIPVRVVDGGVLLCDVWIPRGDEVDVFLETPGGEQFVPDGTETDTPDGPFLADFVENPLNRDQNLNVFLAGRVNDVWSIRIRPITVVHGEVHAWATGTQGGRLIFPGAPLDGYTLGIPATEERAISVGSLVSRKTFEGPQGTATLAGLKVDALSPFSSHGPTRVGVQKPDVVAPGQVVTAALAANSEFAGDPRLASRLHPSGKYVTIQGTSMATPFVAGLVALLLQREPRLTPEDVQQRLRISARRDAGTGPVWNPRYGWGKLDAGALLRS
ncbi:S8 family serine peptidase [Lentzea sp. NPDC003310]|uniref:S8 family serine peptidase n=1 Tax=Lentzea sp. NPDC003310 TaxID=3154447 RepID=UPI0033A5B2D1